MTQKQIDLILNLDTKNATQGANKTVTSLKAIQTQANQTREAMEKLSQIGVKMALVGAAITAPFILAMNKYVATAKDTEPVSKRLVELNKKWEESQVRLGRVTATIVLPALEKGAVILEKVISFAEKNPGVVQAALTIGSTLIILGGLISTTAQLVATVATIQSLAAGAGIALGGGGAAAGAAAGGGLAAAVASGFASILPLIALAIGGQVGLSLGNAISGQNKTWADIGVTLYQLLIITKTGWQRIYDAIIQATANSINALWSGLQWLGTAFVNGFKNIFHLAAGGYASNGIYQLGEGGGREFVMNASTTRSAERAIGGQLTQSRVMGAMTQNINLSNGMTVVQARRMVNSSKNDIIGTFAGAFS